MALDPTQTVLNNNNNNNNNENTLFAAGEIHCHWQPDSLHNGLRQKKHNNINNNNTKNPTDPTNH